MHLKFTKYSGCGNDFILIDNRKQFFPQDSPRLIQKLCHRNLGIGADGVILLEESKHSDFRMRIFNADGNEAEMCGNGIRCLMKFIQAQGMTGKNYQIETFLRTLTVHAVGDNVAVDMGSPFDLRLQIPINLEGIDYMVHHVNTGVPHAVLFVEDVEGFDLKKIGPQIRHHSLFSPEGTNFNIVALKEDGTLSNRTFERGVEGETLACGTGCVASAVIAHQILNLSYPIKVCTRSKEELAINFNKESSILTMTGPANKVFNGEIEINFLE